MLNNTIPSASKIELPSAPNGTTVNGVSAWSEPINIDTYMPEAPDAYPAFLKARVYQGSSGRVYPLPFHDRISPVKEPHRWQAVHVENEWIRLVILPELGGRIHIAYDKVAGYDLFYRNNVIKPALVGLAGPWISGGVEFNWPQHHRPATFLPTDVHIEREDDGAVTVWCSDHDPFTRMKGMHGIRLSPTSSRVEVRVRLYNRSELPQTFLWWANAAAAVNDQYQSFFPPDVHWVADHAKRAVVRFPEPDAPYYGIDYAAKATPGNPDGGRLDWYRNIPVPTSYMALGSTYDFFGGYDHGARAGFVHVAPQEISPGKKQWTWGNAPFGWAWDRNLTDDDGPYVELMAGVYTDNQPDFAFLAAGETKTFSQCWYPVRDIGPACFADERIALSVQRIGDAARVGLCATEIVRGLRILITDDECVLDDRVLDLDPSRSVLFDVPTSTGITELAVVLSVTGVHVGRVVLGGPASKHAPSDAAIAPPAPTEVRTIDELVHIATYLDQYRHATRSAVPYLEEAVARDPEESRATLALGAKAYDRADYEQAAALLRISARRATTWTSTPVSGEAHYRLGLALERLGRSDDARAAFARAIWDSKYSVSGRFALARAHCRMGDPVTAARLLDEALAIDPSHSQSADLLATIARASGDGERANELTDTTLRRDPLDAWARHLAGRRISDDATTVLDVALEYAAAGYTDRALDTLQHAQSLLPSQSSGQVNVGPLIAIHRAALLNAAGDHVGAAAAVTSADRFGFVSAHPSRLDDVDALRSAIRISPTSPLPPALLGHWYYDKDAAVDAMHAWSRALERSPGPELAAVLHRNLGLADYNVRKDHARAVEHYQAALELAPEDAKLWFEADQLAARTGVDSTTRLQRLQVRREVVDKRDDLTVAFAHLLLDARRIEEAADLLSSRQFQPWEGGEGQVIAAWDRMCLLRARAQMATGRVAAAMSTLEAALDPPISLGEGRHPLANVAELHLAMGDAQAAAGYGKWARRSWSAAAESKGDFQNMSATPFSRNTIFAVTALDHLGREEEANRLVAALQAWLATYSVTDVDVDFFATSLPSMLLFTGDPNEARDREVEEIRRQIIHRSGAQSGELPREHSVRHVDKPIQITATTPSSP